MITTIDLERAQAELDKMREEYGAQVRADNPEMFAEWSIHKAIQRADVAAIASEHDRIVNLHRQRIIDAVVSAGGTVTIDDAGEVKVQLPEREREREPMPAFDIERVAEQVNRVALDWINDDSESDVLADRIVDMLKLYAFSAPAPAPVADIDAAAKRYADDIIRRSEFNGNKDAVVFEVEFGGLLWLIAPCVDGATTELALRGMIAHCLADFYREQTGGK